MGARGRKLSMVATAVKCGRRAPWVELGGGAPWVESCFEVSSLADATRHKDDWAVDSALLLLLRLLQSSVRERGNLKFRLVVVVRGDDHDLDSG